MSVTNVKFTVTIDSGNQAVVDQPSEAIRHATHMIMARMHILYERGQIDLRDINGNTIGEARLTMTEGDDDPE